MSDPFKEPTVILGLLFKSGVAQGPFNISRPDAVEFMKAFNEKDHSADSEVMVLKHNTGIASVELHELATVSVSCGSVQGVNEFFDLLI